MLVLSRKKDESIIINDHIRVTVVEIRGDKVRLGIDAPKDVTVHRREVYEAIQNQNRRDPVATPSRASDRSPSPSLLKHDRAGRRPTGPWRRDLYRADVPFISRTNSRIHGPLSGQPRTVTSAPSTTTSRLTNSAPAARTSGSRSG